MNNAKDIAEHIRKVTYERIRLAREVGRLEAELDAAKGRLEALGDDEWGTVDALMLFIEGKKG